MKAEIWFWFCILFSYLIHCLAFKEQSTNVEWINVHLSGSRLMLGVFIYYPVIASACEVHLVTPICGWDNQSTGTEFPKADTPRKWWSPDSGAAFLSCDAVNTCHTRDAQSAPSVMRQDRTRGSLRATMTWGGKNMNVGKSSRGCLLKEKGLKPRECGQDKTILGSDSVRWHRAHEARPRVHIVRGEVQSWFCIHSFICSTSIEYLLYFRYNTKLWEYKNDWNTLLTLQGLTIWRGRNTDTSRSCGKYLYEFNEVQN